MFVSLRSLFKFKNNFGIFTSDSTLLRKIVSQQSVIKLDISFVLGILHLLEPISDKDILTIF
jgi:hypothetical protein